MRAILANFEEANLEAVWNVFSSQNRDASQFVHFTAIHSTTHSKKALEKRSPLPSILFPLRLAIREAEW